MVGVDTFVVGNKIYAIVAAAMPQGGVQLIDVSDPSSPKAVGAARNGSNGFTALAGARDVDTFVVGGKTYAIVAAFYDKGVQLIEL